MFIRGQHENLISKTRSLFAFLILLNLLNFIPSSFALKQNKLHFPFHSLDTLRLLQTPHPRLPLTVGISSL